MSNWPVLVERLDPKTATKFYCESCGKTGEQADPSDGYIMDVASCSCGGTLDYCYWEGVNCGKLDYDMPIKGPDYTHFCSRACQLQAEYARELARR